MERTTAMKVLETYIVAGLTGLLFYHLHSPIPWMLGAITGMLVWKTVIKRPVAAPKALSIGGDPAIVGSLQFVRLLLVIIVVPNVLKWVFRKFPYITETPWKNRSVRN
ncbi:hypothetical protein [Parageobacillus toebii]|uniref:hypothetical protein n=1 Tax=Parageobacillus toebii TaxID=153151 RepID=UPI00281538BF|nr:hypothetical protein [Parageobacillus toebii]WMT18076.1 hypothetical protein RFB12_12170 [Parageobacillus toebii]